MKDFTYLLTCNFAAKMQANKAIIPFCALPVMVGANGLEPLTLSV